MLIGINSVIINEVFMIYFVILYSDFIKIYIALVIIVYDVFKR